MLAWCLWLVICLVFACPASLYSIVCSVPGFMNTHKLLQWCIAKAVSVVTAFLTSFCLPHCAQALASRFTSSPGRIELLSVGKLVTAVVVPCLVHVGANEHCFGKWTMLWEPCQRTSDILNVRVYHDKMIPSDHRRPEMWSIFTDTFMTKAEVCWRAAFFAPRRCAHAMLEKYSQLLLGTLVHFCFTAPATNVLLGAPLKFSSLSVNLVFFWQLSLIFGPSVPLVVLLLILATRVYGHLLSAPVLGADDKDLQGRGAGVWPEASQGFAMAGALLMQVCFTSDVLPLQITVLAGAVLLGRAYHKALAGSEAV